MFRCCMKRGEMNDTNNNGDVSVSDASASDQEQEQEQEVDHADVDGETAEIKEEHVEKENNCTDDGDIDSGVNSDGGGTETNDSNIEEDSYEEECVICLEPLSSQDWGRCTPCQHAFHKQCWWEWENAHKERVDRQRQRMMGGPQQPINDEGPKCCLCNTVNQQFIDGKKGGAANNPRPYVASTDSEDNIGGGNRFTNWFRDVGEEANGFMNFLQSEFRDSWGEAGPFLPRRSPSRRSASGSASDSGRASGNGRRSSSGSFVPPIFGRSSSSRGDRSNNRSSRGSTPFVPPFFGSRTNQTSPSSPYTNNTNNGNPFNQLRPGTQIITQNLINSPHLNGQTGTILRYQRETSRYLVQLEERSNISSFIAGNASPVAIKPENLLQMIKVKICGLVSQPRLNGQEGTIVAYSRQRNRYVIKVEYLLSSTREISIQPTNIRIRNGTCVRLEGLERAPQWNGKYGTIVRWVEDNGNGRSGGSSSGRYEVCLSRQYGVRVKMENVRL